MLENKHDQETNTLTFVFSGHLDSARSAPLAPLVESEIKKHTGQAPSVDKPFEVVFDLKEVDFISSAFIRICIMTAAVVKSGNLILKNACPFIKKTIKISGLESQLKIL